MQSGRDNLPKAKAIDRNIEKAAQGNPEPQDLEILAVSWPIALTDFCRFFLCQELLQLR